MRITVLRIAVTVSALIPLLAPAAYGCGSSFGKAGIAASRLIAPPAIPAGVSPIDGNGVGGGNSIVGMWHTIFLIGTGPAKFDEGFEQWHSDGTEFNLSNGVPPLLGNVCIGVYKQVGTRSYKLRHLTWNWDSSGNFTGTFLLLMTVQVDPHGDTFTGTYVTDSYDPAGVIIPAFHADGVVNGKRITVD